jgi:hypothetical protein
LSCTEKPARSDHTLFFKPDLPQQYAQAARQLQRVGLPPDLLQRLHEKNFVSARDLYDRTLVDLVEVLDLPLQAVEQILRDVAAKIVPAPVTVRAPLLMALAWAARIRGGGLTAAAAAAPRRRWTCSCDPRTAPPSCDPPCPRWTTPCWAASPRAASPRWWAPRGWARRSSA